MTAPTLPPSSDGIEWKRPHPVTLLIEFVSAVRDLIFPIVFLLFQGARSSDVGAEGASIGETIFTNIVPLIAISLPIGTAVARYFTTRYALTDEALLHNYGVLKRNKQVLPRRNIQNLSTSAGLIARATGLQELTVSDASQGGDIELRLLSVEDAESLMTLLRQDVGHRASGNLEGSLPADGMANGGPGLAPPTSGASAFIDDPVHASELSDLLKLRLATSGGSVLGLLAVFALIVAYLTIPELGDAVPGFVGIGVVAPVAAGLLSAVAPVFSLGGFRLWSDPDRLRIKTGLLTEIQLNARRERLQLVRVNRHVLAQRLGLEAIQFETADVEGNTRHVNYLAPAIALDSWPAFASDALGEVELGEDDLLKVSPLTRRRSLVRFGFGGVGLILAAAIAVFVAPSGNRPIIAALAVFAFVAYAWLAVWYAGRRARRLGWAMGEDQFLFRSGVIGEQLVLVRKEKLQVLRIHQSFFQRRLKLATIQLGTAGIGLLGNVVLPDLELEVATQVIDHLADASSHTMLSRTL